MFKWLRDLIRPKQRQYTFAYCPQCHNELVADPETTYEYTSEGLVRYDCGRCHAKHLWDLDAPAPILIRQEPRLRVVV
jgi:hypothetical protein